MYSREMLPYSFGTMGVNFSACLRSSGIPPDKPLRCPVDGERGLMSVRSLKPNLFLPVHFLLLVDTLYCFWLSDSNALIMFSFVRRVNKADT